jgi:acyl carrier protein
VPAAIVPVKSVPLTSSGKLDRRSLPAPTDASRADEAYVPPRSETEQTIVDVWQNVLNVGRIGVYDNFFELGGHSLLATQVVSRLREGFGLEVPLQNIFEGPTVAEMARNIEALRWAADRGEADPPGEDTVEGTL